MHRITPRPRASLGRIPILSILLAIFASPLAAQTTLVPTGATWSYLDDGSNQGTTWRQPSFNDGTWATGPAQLGYGDGDEATTVSFGGNSSNKFITTYFRHSFNVADPSIYGSVTLRLLRDDGAVVYLNGTEVDRQNMPGGTVSSSTTASTAVSGASESAFFSKAVSASLLQVGANVVAVEIHQSSGSSSDISFDLELLGNTGSGSVIVDRGPYLQQGTPSSMVVRWRTDIPSDSRVRYGTDPANLDMTSTDTSQTIDHQVQLSGLSPETTYYYAVGTTSEDLAGGNATTFFKTSPPAGTARPMRIWAVGDSGTANADARAVRDAYKTFTESTYTNLFLMLGDNAYNDGTQEEYQAAVFDTYPELLRQSPLWSTLGNHDGHTADSTSESGPYYDIFTLPRNAEAGGVASGTEAYYSFDYSNIHFVVLNSYDVDRSTNGAMLTWLEADLQSATAEWLVAFWHHPPYTKGSHNSDNETQLAEMRQNALPILESYGVDLVLSGHSHSYERSFLIDGHYGKSSTFSSTHQVDGGDGDPTGDGAYVKGSGINPNQGAVYIVAGASGKISGGQLNHPAMHVSLNELGSVVVDVDDTTMDVIYLNDNGTVRDVFTITKGGPLGATIRGAAWDDQDDDGLRIAEPGVSGVDVELLDGTGATLASRTTAADGGYAFTGLAAGTYTVRFSGGAGMSLTAQDVGLDDTIDSDADPVTGETASFAVLEGELISNIDAGWQIEAPSCQPQGSSCTSNSDCCSNKCRGKSGSKTCK